MALLPNTLLLAVTFLSGFIAFFLQKEIRSSTKLLLSFSGAFLLSTCVIHLLPELFEDHDLNVAPFILAGFFLQILIEYISQGVEHGHVHIEDDQKHFPYLIYGGLCFHAFTEGLPLSGVDYFSLTVSPLYWSILLHKIPIAIVLVSLLLKHNLSNFQLLTSLVIFSFMAPLGGTIGKVVTTVAGTNVLPYFLAFATGIFLHISTVILFETSQNHRFNFLKFVFILAGGLLSIFLF